MPSGGHPGQFRLIRMDSYILLKFTVGSRWIENWVSLWAINVGKRSLYLEKNFHFSVYKNTSICGQYEPTSSRVT